MNFAEAWAAFEIGAYVAVSDGMPEIPRAGNVSWRIWRSHNHIGKLVDKIEQTPRRMVVELSPINGATTQYELVEGLGHSFTASTKAAAINDASATSAKMEASQ